MTEAGLIMAMGNVRSAIIVGAGVVGMSTAYAFARRGISVTIIDEQHRPGMGASWGNGRQLSYAYTDALAHPGLWRQLPSLLTSRNGGISLAPPRSYSALCWMARFAANMTARKFKQNTQAGLALAQQSRRAMEALLRQHPLDFDHRVAGKMHLFDDAQALERAAAIMDWKRAAGNEQRLLGADEARAIEPALADRTTLAGAIYSPDEAIGNGSLFCQRMDGLLSSQYGSASMFDMRVTQIHRHKGETRVSLGNGEVRTADLAVVCAGANRAVARDVGIDLPILPMKGYSFTAPKGSNAPLVSLTDASRRIVFTDLGNRILVAGIAELGMASRRVDPERIETLISLAQDSLPDAADYAQATDFWAGLRPMTPNSLPIIGMAREGIAVNMGHGMLGWTLAMGSGEHLAQSLA